VETVALLGETHVNVFGPIPPEAATVAAPVQKFGQVILVTVDVNVIDVGWVMLKATVFVQRPLLF
jgi:hypothetical protein